MLSCSDYGFDPLGLMDPVNSGGFITPQWLAYSEVCSSGNYNTSSSAAVQQYELYGAITQSVTRHAVMLYNRSLAAVCRSSNLLSSVSFSSVYWPW